MNNILKDLPLEIERKYLISYPDIGMLKQCPRYSSTKITQTYLTNDNATHGMRIRKRGSGNTYTYYKTFKQDITPLKRIEIEDIITADKYNALLKKADPSLQTISKVRHCFMYKEQMFELDIYTFWKDRAILEIELESENDNVYLPPFLNVIKEVTNDLRYRNRALAKNVLSEEI